jgi:drug/metabolite transporter (DMT)-like permease
MNGSAVSAGLGFVSAASWGGSDFVGGLGSRRSPALLVVLSGQVLAFFLLAALCLGLRFPFPGMQSSVCAIVGGVIGSLALALFYRALAMGSMGSSAAITGLLTAVVPVVFSLLHNGLPSGVNGAGLAAGLAAIWLITSTPAADGMAQKPAKSLYSPLGLAALAGLGFGTQLILMKIAGAGGVCWAMTLTRAAGVVALSLVLLFSRPRRPWGRFWQAGLPAGVLDSTGVALYIVASQIGRLDAVAVTCSFYPAVTILLAAAVLHERPTRRQTSGMALAVAAVALLSL